MFWIREKKIKEKSGSLCSGHQNLTVFIGRSHHVDGVPAACHHFALSGHHIVLIRASRTTVPNEFQFNRDCCFSLTCFDDSPIPNRTLVVAFVMSLVFLVWPIGIWLGLAIFSCLYFYTYFFLSLSLSVFL